MKSKEVLTGPGSEYFIHTASAEAQDSFLYPTVLGDFHYLPGYQLFRNRFDSFLLLYLYDGTFTFVTEDARRSLTSGDAALIDCHMPHEYGTATGARALWLHFDGVAARGLVSYLVRKNGPVFTLREPEPFLRTFSTLLRGFISGCPADEESLSFAISTLLHELSGAATRSGELQNDGISKSISYIDTHLKETLSLEELSTQAGFSPYYFTRLFRRHTGMTPHQYVLTARLNFAKYLLSSTSRTIEEISAECGFSDVSNFCFRFRKTFQEAPGKYRQRTIQTGFSEELPDRSKF